MADNTAGTDSNASNGTDGTPPAATQDNNSAGGNPPENPEAGTDTGKEEVVTLKKKDYDNLVGQRDRNYNKPGELDEATAEMQFEFYQNKAIEALTSKEEYKDVPREVLKTAESPEAMENLAKVWVAQAAGIKQKALEELQNVDPEALSPTEKAEQLEKLKGTGKLAQALDLKLRRNK